jgi:[protein-PII] uridylyltransferase
MKNVKFAFKDKVILLKEELQEKLLNDVHILPLTNRFVAETDTIILEIFHKNELERDNQFCLLALGSYGRRELQLHSDIDLLLLHEENLPEVYLQRVHTFLQDCWDAGLEISHQVTTVNACADLAAKDLTVISSLLDMRLLCGRGSLMEELLYKTHASQMWTSLDYFNAKQLEQKKRYAKYGETAYNLEPNVKNGPGGLRDLQVLLHISKRHYGIKKLADGINCGFLSEKEYEELIHCQHYLWRVRFALHFLAKKKEERLLFDHQVKLASLFGYRDQEHSLAIEQFMKAYFKIIKRSRELNETLIQWFDEAIVHQKQTLIHLDNTFQLSNNNIEIRNPKGFVNKPLALLELFLWLVKQPVIEGVRANTIRLIRQHLYLLDKRFSTSPEAAHAFMEILKTENNPYEALQLMSRYGVLGKYLECFSAVTGQMQYDLFHVFTVDQHTLFVIRNLGRFLSQDYTSQFLLCSKLMQKIPKREILYLSALFHDIGKGRGGDHSELGALEAQQFAERHYLASEDLELLVWLVRHHLLMSHTAQRQDIYDPKTIKKFCAYFPKEHYLDYLYLLTVADICGTNPNLWNAWKDSLLKELYYAAKDGLKQETELLDESSLILKRRQQALEILVSEAVDPNSAEDLWKQFKEKYFLHEPPEIIARHTKAILETNHFPLVLIMPHHTLGGTEVFIYMPHRDDRFTITTTVLSNHQVTIQEAVILTCDNNFDMDTYVILNEKNQAFLDDEHIEIIKNALINHLLENQPPEIIRQRISRTQAHFKIKPQIIYSTEQYHTGLFLITSDRPGLLSRISRVFYNEKIHLHNAKIATAGERVEDMFYLSNYKGEPLTGEEQENLKQKLSDELNRQILKPKYDP